MRALLVTCSIAAVFACSENPTVVRVTVESGDYVPPLDQLRVDVEGTQTTFGEGDLLLPATFTITPGDQRPDLMVRVEGLVDEDVRGLGEVRVDLERGKVVDATLTLGTADFDVSSPGSAFALANESPAGGAAQVASVAGESIVVFADVSAPCANGCPPRARVFDDQGTPLATSADASGGVFSLGAENVVQPVVAANATGVVMVAFLRFTVVGGERVSGEVVGRVIDPANGWEVSDPFDVGLTGTDPANPAIVALGNGNFVIVWSEFPEGEADRQIVARIFDGTGAPLTAQFPVSVSGSAFQPALAALGSSTWLVLWRGASLSSGNDLLLVRQFTDAVADVAEATVDSGAVFSAVGATGFDNGTAITTWPRGGQSIELNYQVRRLAGPTPDGSPLTVGPWSGTASRPQVVAVGDQEVAIIYHTCPGGECDVLMVHYSVPTTGPLSPLGQPVPVPTDSTNDQVDPAAVVVRNASGDPQALLISWTERVEGADSLVQGRIIPLGTRP